MTKNNYIAFTLKSNIRNELLATNECSRVVLLPIDDQLKFQLASTAQAHGLDTFKVLRALTQAYLLVRKSAQEDPFKGLRAMVRSWLKKVSKGQAVNLSKYATAYGVAI